MFRHNARLRKRRPSSPPFSGGEERSLLPSQNGRGGERPRAPLPFSAGAVGTPRRSRPAQGRGPRGRGPAWSRGGAGGGPGPAPPARAGQRAGVERGGAGGGTGPAPKARAGQRAGVERGGRRRGTGSRAQGPRGAEGRRGAGGGILLGSRNAAVSPSPPFSAGRRGASRSPPHEAPAAGSRSGAGQMPESGDESQGIAVKGLLCSPRGPRRKPGREVQRAAGVTPRTPRTPRAPAAASPAGPPRTVPDDAESEREREAARDRERDSERWITRLVHR